MDSAEYAPLNFEEEGFIHCCDLHQLELVASRYFPGRDDLVVLELIPTELDPETKYEKSGDERFPHIYGPINKSAINQVLEFQCNPDGEFNAVFSGFGAPNNW